jgi:hypothetical protein
MNKYLLNIIRTLYYNPEDIVIPLLVLILLILSLRS